MVRIISLAVLFFYTLISPQVSNGEAWVIEPSIRLSGQYDDNIRLSPGSSDSVFGSELTGAVKLSRLTDILEFRGLAQASFTNYTGDNAPENQDDQFIDFSSLYKTQRDRWHLDGSYRRDTLLRTADLIIEPDDITVPDNEDIDTLSVRRSIQRDRIIVNPSWNRRATERIGYGLIYRLNHVTYDDVEDVDLDDFIDHTVRGRVSYNLSEIDRVSAIAESKFFRSIEGDNEFDSYSLLASIDHRFSETTRGELTVGIRHTSFERANNEEGDELGYRFRLDGTKQTKFGTFGLRLERDLFPSGFGRLFETNQLILRMDRRILPRLDFSLRARFFDNNSIDQEDSLNDRVLFFIEPRLSWNLTRWWSVDASYRYRWEERDFESESADSNAFFVFLNYARPTTLDDSFL